MGDLKLFVMFNLDKHKRKRVLAVGVGERKTHTLLNTVLQKLNKRKINFIL